MPLTDRAITLAKPTEKPYKLSDEKGLYLLIHPRGAKYWRLKYRLAGKEKVLAIGVYPEVSLASARSEVESARKDIGAGIDPGLARKERERRCAIASANTFKSIALEWVEMRRDGWTPGHTIATIESLEKNVFPALGKIPISNISAFQLLQVLRVIERRGALEVASRVAQRCAAVFRYAVQTDRLKASPCPDLRGALKTRKVKHQPALNAADLPEFLQKLEDYDGYKVTKLALNFLLLTFVRPGELRGAKWEEIDLAKQEWRIPAERMKMREEHVVPLSKQAVSILYKTHVLTGKRDLVFASQIEPRRPMSENTLLFAMYRMGYHSKATAHGFRATASTILNEAGFNADVIERQLAHAERNKTRAAYNRSQYLDARRKMMQWWADYLDRTGISKARQRRLTSVA